MSASIVWRLMTPLSVVMAFGLAACASEEAPTEPSGGTTPALATVAAYTAVDLGTLGGATARPLPSTRQARWWVIAMQPEVGTPFSGRRAS
jgi:hypothetical protein